MTRHPFAALVALAAALAAGCASLHPLPVPAEPGKTFATAGPVLGSRQVRPTHCYAGGHFSFLGANLVDESTQVYVRVVLDPLEGTAVRVFDDHHSDRLTVAFRRADCQRMDVALKPTGSMVNGVVLMSLKVDLDCRDRDGNAVVGTFDAPECD